MMAVRIGWILSALALGAALIFAVLESSQTPPDAAFAVWMFVMWYGGIALAVIWLAVLVAVGVGKALRFRRDG
jgi:hypothetical protein